MNPEEGQLRVLGLMNLGVFTLAQIAERVGITAGEAQNAVACLIDNGLIMKYLYDYKNYLEITNAGRIALSELAQ